MNQKILKIVSILIRSKIYVLKIKKNTFYLVVNIFALKIIIIIKRDNKEKHVEQNQNMFKFTEHLLKQSNNNIKGIINREK